METKNQLGEMITLKKIADPRGNLTVAEQFKDLPFGISRVYWTYDIPTDAERGGHAHIHCRELIIALSGSFTVTLDNGSQRKPYMLTRPYEGCLSTRVSGERWRISPREPSAWCWPKIRLMSMITFTITTNT